MGDYTLADLRTRGDRTRVFRHLCLEGVIAEGDVLGRLLHLLEYRTLTPPIFKWSHVRVREVNE